MTRDADDQVPADAASPEAVASWLEAGGGFRVLRRLDVAGLVRPPPAGGVGSAVTRVVGLADIETEGLEASSRIVEIAVRRLRVDAEGEILEIGREYSFLEDPGRPLDPRVARLTGLSDADLAGRAIDERLAAALLRSCEPVVFHNAAFDAPRILDRLPAVAGTPFACSLREVDWRARGFGGALTLGCLLCQSGAFAPKSHRAGADVDATIGLLAHRDVGGRTALAELLETAARPTWRVSAYGAAFGEPKDALKARGYRWDPDARVWSREVSADRREAECAWLAEHVYDPRWNPKCEGPHVEAVDWTTRHA